MQNNRTEYDIIIVGGGISGLAVAYGLYKKNPQCKLAIVDAPTEVNKASRTNVGLLWCQSKFLEVPEFARLGIMSCRIFPELLKELHDDTGVNVTVNYTGGLIPTVGEAEYKRRSDYIDNLKTTLVGSPYGDYKGSMLSYEELSKKLPKIKFGEEVTGAAWCEDDGIVDPLLLLRTYRQALEKLGAHFIADTLVYDIVPQNGQYKVNTSKGSIFGERLVMAAGLANRRLVQFDEAFQEKALPIFADKGQVFLTERLPYVMPIPVLGCTQTFGGTVIIGFKHETRGHDATVIPSAVAQEGAWALKVWPELAKKRIIRTWPGLRVMPDDKVAIYSHLPNHKNVTLINTHSAVTFAAVHTRILPDYIMGNELAECAQNMTLKRFGFDC